MKQFTVLVVSPFYPAGPITYIAQAFERIGCRVVRIGYVCNNHMGLNWGTDAVVPDRGLSKEAPCWDLNEFVDWTTRHFYAPDFLLCSEENYQTDIIPTRKVPSALWSMDGWPRNYDRADLWQCTVNFTNHPLGIDLYPRDEIDPRWRFLPGAAAPWIHKYLRLVRDCDFCLLGSNYGKRESLCRELAERGGFKVRYGQASTYDYVGAYNHAVTTFHNARPGEIKWRFWEAAAMGCINISGYSKLFSWLGYKPFIHYYPVSTPLDNEWPDFSNLADIMKYLIDNDALQRNMVYMAMRKTLSQDTYYHRAKTICKQLGMLDLEIKTDRAIEKMLADHGLNFSQ